MKLSAATLAVTRKARRSLARWSTWATIRRWGGGRRPAELAHGNMVADQDGTFHIQGLVPDTPIALQAELNGRLSDVVTISSIDPGFERSGIVLRMQ